MSCQSYRDAIALHAGADLSAEQVSRLQQHLEDCADCRLLLEQLVADRRAVQQLAARPVEADRIAAVRSAVLEQVTSHPAKHGSTHWKWLALAATVVLALTAVLMTRPWQQTAGHVELARLDPTPLPPPTDVETSEPPPLFENEAESKMEAVVSTEDGRAFEASAPQSSMVASTELLQQEAPLHGGDTATRSGPAAHQSPLLVKLVSESKDVVIFWLVDAGGSDADQRVPEPKVSKYREEQRDEQQPLSIG
jgi:hypothetical protein